MRISIRDKIFREAVANSLIHREYSRAYVAKMIITSDKVIFENANIPHFYGELNPLNFTPYPKNPSIAKIFREIGFADELGSGVKNIYKYAKEYGGSDPIMVEDEVFRVEIKTDNDTTPKTTPKTTKEKLIDLIAQDSKITRDELAKALNISVNTVKEYILKMKKENTLERIGDNRNGYWKINFKKEEEIR